MTISIRFDSNNENSNVLTKANSIDNSFNRICNISEDRLLDNRKRWRSKANNYNVVDYKLNWCIWEISSFNRINEIEYLINRTNDLKCEFSQNDLNEYNEQYSMSTKADAQC